MPDFCRDKKATQFLDIFFLLFIFLFFFLLNLPFAAKQFLSPDASLYLDAARNVASGRGAVILFNQYQFWHGAGHPLWAYTQPLFPLLAALPFKLGGVSGVITLNIFLFALNCSLIYLLVRRHAGVFVAAAAALFSGFSYNVVYTAVYPWTEPLFLTMILAAFYLYLGPFGDKRYFWVGAVLGVSCLVRAAGVYAACMFFVAVLLTDDWIKEKRYGFFLLLGGFLAVTGGYEIFCLVNYHAFYPEYVAAGLNFNNARNFPGAFYSGGKGVLHACAQAAMFLRDPVEVVRNIKNLAVFFDHALFLLVAPLVYFAAGAYRRAGAFIRLLVFYGIFNFIFCFLFMESMGLEWLRILLVGFIALVIASLLLISREKSILRIVFVPVAIYCFVMTAADYFSFRSTMLEGYACELAARRATQRPFYHWIEKNTRHDDIVAVQFIDEGFWFDRPVIALPPGAMVNEKNIRDFVRIYRPRYVLAQDERIVGICRRLGFSDKIKSGGFLLLEAV